MRSIIIVVFLACPSFIFDQTYTSQNTGLDTDQATWIGTVIVNCNTLRNRDFIISTGTQVTFECTYDNAKGLQDIEVQAGGEAIFDGPKDVTLEGAAVLLQSADPEAGGIMSIGTSTNPWDLTIVGSLVVQDGAVLTVWGDLDVSVSATLEIQGTGQVIVKGDVDVDGTNRQAIVLTDGGDITIDGNYSSSNGTLMATGVEGSTDPEVMEDFATVTVKGDMIVSGSQRIGILLNEYSALNVAGTGEVSGSAAIVILSGSAEFENGLNILGEAEISVGSDISDGLLTVNNDLILAGSGKLFLYAGEVIVQSIDNDDGSFTGGSVFLEGDALVEVYAGLGTRFQVLGNRYIAGLPEEDVIGDLNLEVGTTFEVIVEDGDVPFEPQVWISNDVNSEPFDFFTDWIPGADVSVPIIVVMGGETCNNWTGPEGAIAGACDAGDDVLPVELIAFSAEVLGENVILEWETALEISNDYFTVQRSYNGEDYDQIGMVDGSGDSDKSMKYTFTDKKPLPGPIYYRLKQTDFDGQYEEFDAIQVLLTSEHQSAMIYPNPLRDDQLNIQLLGFEENQTAHITISDLTGKIVMLESFYIEREGVVLTLDVADKLRPGTYILHMDQGSRMLTRKLLKM